MVARPPGLYLVHKPRGPTSSDVTRGFSDGRCSHAGTLDPFAEGLLLVLVGPATKFLDLFHEAPKTYVARIAWGVETATGDLHGAPTAEGDASTLTEASATSALTKFLGWSEQTPPATSAKKLHGEPAYKKAHRGEDVQLPPSRVFLHSARFTSHRLPAESALELVCRGGFYVRALARDLGRALGCRAHLAALSRPRIGPYVAPEPGAAPAGVPRAEVLPWLPSCVLSDAQMGEVKRGRPISPVALSPPTWSFPSGFPAARPMVRAFHLGKLVTLLEPAPDAAGLWRTRYALGRGI